jgi:hypothetical protein
MKYEARVRATNGIAIPVTVDADNKMYAVEMVNRMYGAENVLQLPTQVREEWKTAPVREPVQSVDALSEARIKEDEAKRSLEEFEMNCNKFNPSVFIPYPSAQSYSSNEFSHRSAMHRGRSRVKEELQGLALAVVLGVIFYNFIM